VDLGHRQFVTDLRLPQLHRLSFPESGA